jgi:branched-chain amino acid transport system substrate-binding protein
VDRRRFLAVAAGSVAGGAAFAGQFKGVIRIVSSLPRTGSAKAQTDSLTNGIELAVTEVRGEVAGYKIEYVDCDDASAADGYWDAVAEGMNAKNAARDRDAMAYVGPYNSGAAKISMPITNEAGLLQISPACTWPGLTKKTNLDPNEPEAYRPSKKINFCRVCPTDDTQGPLSAVLAKDELKAKSVYVLDDKELYGAEIAAAFKKKCEELGIMVLGHESIVTVRTEFKQIAQKAAATKPELVYFGGTTQTKAGQVIKDLRAAGFKGPVMVPDGCYEQAFIKSAEGQDLVNVYATIGGIDASTLTGRGAAFVKRYKAAYKKDPEAYAVYGYEAARVVLAGIQAVGKKDREAIRKAVLATKDFEGGALDKWSFDANGDTTLQQLTISKIEDGKFVPVRVVTGG